MTVHRVVRQWAERDPDHVCFVFHQGAGEPIRLTYAELARRASAYARHFQAHGLRSGDAIVLFAPTAPGFVAAFLGAQEAGLMPVPCPPPERLESGRRIAQRVRDVVTHCEARALVDPAAEPLDARVIEELATHGIPILQTRELTIEAGTTDPGPVSTTPHRFAYCQFTSGSGGVVKGVLLTHDNVMANIRAAGAAWRFAPDDVAVTWVPFFHDLGLVGYMLSPLFHHAPAHYMSPLAFLARPMAWLELMSRVGGTVATAPNLAYGLCARRATDEEVAALDLSRWRIACCGSEPITRTVVEAFCRRFAPSGFRASSLIAAYGLAEDTLATTSGRPGEGLRFDEVSRDALEREGIARPARPGTFIASVGWPILEQEVVVAGPDGAPLPDRHVGEVRIRGASVMAGYLPGTTEVALGPDGWLMTGDLGYFADGELYLVGRKKDLIIRAGRNYYPQDLEDAALQIKAVRRAVAFAVPTEELERVVLGVECRPEEVGDPAALVAAVKAAVFAAVRLAPDEILVLPRGAVPLTSSGKLMRPEARRLYLEGLWSTSVPG